MDVVQDICRFWNAQDLSALENETLDMALRRHLMGIGTSFA